MYINGAIGPECDCIIYDENMIINKAEKLCHNKYVINKTINFMTIYSEKFMTKRLLISLMQDTLQERKLVPTG